MAFQAFTGRESIGAVQIERFRDSIRLRWRSNGKRYSLTIGKDSKDAIKAARIRAEEINSDITFNRFDATLSKYGKNKPTVLELIIPEAIPAIRAKEISLRNLWDKFLEDKLPHLKAKTQDEYRNFTRLLDKVEEKGSAISFNALETKHALLSITTADQTRRMLQYFSACCGWGMKHRLIAENPYKGLASDMPKRSSITNPTPNAFTPEEREATIEAFKNDTRPGMNYPHYAPIVEFWFFTGCRPSEAIGLCWENVSLDCSQVVFDGSIQTINGVQIRSEGSKNNKVRSVAVSSRVQNLLLSIRPEDFNPKQFVFPSPTGRAINYPNFLSKIWHKVVDPIKSDTTPYNCRDTFITMQLLNGVPSAVIANWCDTSTGMIDRAYADKLKLSQLRPKD